MMRWSAKFHDTWDKLDSEMRELIEKKANESRYTPGKREYATCVRCRGSGRLIAHVEAVWQKSEALARAFWRSRGYNS